METLVTAAQMAEIDKVAQEQGIPGMVLMENAGQHALRIWLRLALSEAPRGAEDAERRMLFRGNKPRHGRSVSAGLGGDSVSIRGASAVSRSPNPGQGLLRLRLRIP